MLMQGLRQMHVTVSFVIINTQDMLTVRIAAFSAL